MQIGKQIVDNSLKKMSNCAKSMRVAIVDAKLLNLNIKIE